MSNALVFQAGIDLAEWKPSGQRKKFRPEVVAGYGLVAIRRNSSGFLFTHCVTTLEYTHAKRNQRVANLTSGDV
jgi:hypothetical protein